MLFKFRKYQITKTYSATRATTNHKLRTINYLAFPFEDELLLKEVELLPDVELLDPEVLEVERPVVLLPLPPEVLLLAEAVDLLPPVEALLREALLLPAVALLSFDEVPLALELLPVLPEVDVLEEVLLLVVPLLEDAGDFDALLVEEPLFEDSLLELFSLGVPPVVRLVPVLLFEEAERALPEVFWLEVFFVCARPDRLLEVELFWPELLLLVFVAIINGFYVVFQNTCHGMIMG